MSWSYRITALYLGFVGIIVTLVTIASRQKIELESKDYYQQELNYQNRLDAIKNNNALEKSIEHKVNEAQIILTIPVAQLTSDFSGEIYFFCPANSANDVNLKMEFNGAGQQSVQKTLLKKGAYKMRLSWSSLKRNYFKEEIITIN